MAKRMQKKSLKRKSSKTKSSKSAKRLKKNKGFVKAVKSIVNGSAETKFHTSVTNPLPFKCVVGSTTYTPHLLLLPKIPESDFAGGRIGDKVTITKSIAHITIWANAYNAVENNVYLPIKYVFWLVSSKRNHTSNFSETGIITRLFNGIGEGQSGNQIVGLSGNFNLDDNFRPNTAEFTIHKKWRKTLKMVEETQGEHTHRDIPYLAKFSVDVGKYLKQVTFSPEDENNQIRDKNLWLIGFSYYEGLPTGGPVTPATWQCVHNTWYKDM